MAADKVIDVDRLADAQPIGAFHVKLVLLLFCVRRFDPQRAIAVLSRLFLLACLVVSPAALAQPYPDRNVTIVVTSAPGAMTDTLTRAIAQHLAEMWKRSVIVENRGGAGYAIAAQYVTRAEHDGYTLLASEI